MRPSSFIRCRAFSSPCVVGSGILGARLLPQDDAGARLAKARDLLAAGKPADAATLLDAFPGDPAKDEASREARALRVRGFVAAKEWERAVASGTRCVERLAGVVAVARSHRRGCGACARRKG
jgi:hypothetical protein